MTLIRCSKLYLFFGSCDGAPFGGPGLVSPILDCCVKGFQYNLVDFCDIVTK